jgi:hypothetical protein
MTDSEFRIWLKGFCAALNGGPPSEEQWRQIILRMNMTESTCFPYNSNT